MRWSHQRPEKGGFPAFLHRANPRVWDRGFRRLSEVFEGLQGHDEQAQPAQVFWQSKIVLLDPVFPVELPCEIPLKEKERFLVLSQPVLALDRLWSVQRVGILVLRRAQAWGLVPAIVPLPSLPPAACVRESA